MPNPTLYIRTERDDDFDRACTILAASGFEVERALPPKKDRKRVAAAEVARRCELTEREHEILTHVIDGKSNDEISGLLEVVRATVKWHMHNIFVKTETGTREALLRLALHL